MKYVSFSGASFVVHKLKYVFVALAALFAATSASFATGVTTINWTGTNDFNDSSITFTPFKADQLEDIFGTGLYEACCKTGNTDFTLQIRVGEGRKTSWETILKWSTTGDDTTHALGDLVPPVINFNLAWISGIRLTSDPNGRPSSDYNFTSFNFVTYLSPEEYFNLNRSKYKSWEDFENCDDYQRYVEHVTSFVFCTDCVSTQGGLDSATPLPAALPLFISGGGLFGFIGWRRKRRKAQLAV
jgi:hypothetical protein